MNLFQLAVLSVASLYLQVSVIWKLNGFRKVSASDGKVTLSNSPLTFNFPF